MDSVSSGSLPVSTGTEVDDLAEELGMLGEETFTVKQSHIKKNPVSGAKVPKEVTLKVGGMGLNIFDGGIPVENHLYFALQGWTYSQERNTFDITLKAEQEQVRGGSRSSECPQAPVAAAAAAAAAAEAGAHRRRRA